MRTPRYLLTLVSLGITVLFFVGTVLVAVPSVIDIQPLLRISFALLGGLVTMLMGHSIGDMRLVDVHTAAGTALRDESIRRSLARDVEGAAQLRAEAEREMERAADRMALAWKHAFRLAAFAAETFEKLTKQAPGGE